MEKQKYIDIFWSNSTGKEKKGAEFRNTWERVAKKLEKEDNVSALFMFPVDYCLYEMLSEQDESLRMPNVMHGYERENPEVINVIDVAAMDWRVIFHRYKEIKAEYKCTVKLTVLMSCHLKEEIEKLLEKEDSKELSEFMEVLTLENLVLAEDIGWINVAKRVLLTLCHEQNRNRIRIEAIEFSPKKLLALQRGDEYWRYQGYATQIPDLIFDKNIRNGMREIQHGIFHYTESVFPYDKHMNNKIQMFIKCSWNDRKRFVCDFKPIVYMPALSKSDVDKIFGKLFPKMPKKKSISKIKKYKYIQNFFECTVAVAFKYYAEMECPGKFIWKGPKGIPEISELLEKRRHEFLNMLMEISIGRNEVKQEYFTEKDFLYDEGLSRKRELFGNKIKPTDNFGKMYKNFKMLMIIQNRQYKENFVSVEKYQKVIADYLIKDTETQKLFGVFMMEHLVEDGMMIETYREKNGFIQQGFVPCENLEVLL